MKLLNQVAVGAAVLGAVASSAYAENMTKEECDLSNTAIAGILFVTGTAVGLVTGVMALTNTILGIYKARQDGYRAQEQARVAHLTVNPLLGKAKDVEAHAYP